MSLATHDFDGVVEGTKERVTDPAAVADMAARWADGGWPASVDDSGVALTTECSAPSAGPPPWFVSGSHPTGPMTCQRSPRAGGATRWTFSDENG